MFFTRAAVSTMPRTSSSSSVGRPIMKYSFMRWKPRPNTRSAELVMSSSVTFLVITSRMRWVPASGAKVSPWAFMVAMSASRSSFRP